MTEAIMTTEAGVVKPPYPSDRFTWRDALLMVEPPEPCKVACEFCRKQAAVASNDERETLACFECAIVHELSIDAIYVGNDQFDAWENVVDEYRLKLSDLQDRAVRAEECARINGQTIRDQQSALSKDIGAAYKRTHELQDERNALSAEVEKLKRGQVTPELDARLMAFVLEYLGDIVVENGSRRSTIAQLIEDGDTLVAAKHVIALRADLLRTAGRDKPRRLCAHCRQSDCGGCVDESDCEFTLPVQLREALKERKTA